MHKKILILFFSLISGIIFSMDQIPSDHLQKEKAKVVKEIQKNTAQLRLIEKTKLADAFSKIKLHITTIISSPEFQSIIKAMTTKQAQEIAQGKTFDEVKYNHSLSSEFPNLANPQKFLAFAYSVMANIAHYQLLLEKLNTFKEPQTTQAPVTTPSDITKAITP